MAGYTRKQCVQEGHSWEGSCSALRTAVQPTAKHTLRWSQHRLEGDSAPGGLGALLTSDTRLGNLILSMSS